MAAIAYIGREDPVARWGGGRQSPLYFFCQGSRCKFEKKLHLRPVVLWGATGGIFEIFQNGHIFLKFLFFKKYKKEKTAPVKSGSGIRVAAQLDRPYLGPLN
mgnify:CR=1 FL=1